MEPILELEDLSFGYPNAAEPVLAGVSLSLPRGGFLGLVGPSGVGKSSLLRVIAGLAPPRSGRVHLRSKPDPTTRPTAIVFQDARLLPWRRVLQNVEFGLEGLPLAAPERRQRAQSALALVGLAEHARKFPHQLSGGQRQRVGIARALAVRPGLLLVDEPFGALDAITRDLLQDELLRLWQETGATIVFVTHDLAEAVYLADRVILLGGTPARIVREIDVDIPRPRRRQAPAMETKIGQLRQAMGQGFIEGEGI